MNPIAVGFLCVIGLLLTMIVIGMGYEAVDMVHTHLDESAYETQPSTSLQAEIIEKSKDPVVHGFLHPEKYAEKTEGYQYLPEKKRKG